MRKKLHIKLLALIGIFFVTSIVVHGFVAATSIKKKPPLSDYLGSINGYQQIRQTVLPEKLVAMLKLDDYAFIDFSDELGNFATLYVGYYYTSGKAYSAHSPTVCYPSQGWRIVSKPTRNVLGIGDNNIHYEEIVTQFGIQKELVLYWYQAGEHTNNSVYGNKISMGFNKMLYKNEQHSFVRVSVPFNGNTYEENKKNVITFIQSFYPQFLKFIVHDIVQ